MVAVAALSVCVPTYFDLMSHCALFALQEQQRSPHRDRDAVQDGNAYWLKVRREHDHRVSWGPMSWKVCRG